MLREFRERLRGMRRAIAFRLMPSIAEAAVSAASAGARSKLRAIRPVRLLLDSTIHAHAITHEDTWIDTGEVLWGGVHAIQTGYAARVPIHSRANNSRQYQDVCRITVIATLARKGMFELYTSAELMAERTRHPPARFETVGYSDFSLLDGLKIESLDGWNFDSFTTGGASSEQLSIMQRERMRSSDNLLFAQICDIFGSDKHSQDAWHIATAQQHQMYALLTMDYSLVRLVNAQQKKLRAIGITTRILTPSALGHLFGFGAVPPRFFSYNDASFPVRADLHMPGERRRRGRKQSTV